MKPYLAHRTSSVYDPFVPQLESAEDAMQELRMDAVYGMRRALAELNCSRDTVLRTAAKTGIDVKPTSGGRKFTGAQIESMRRFRLANRRYPDRPANTATVSETARELGVQPDTVRKAIKRIEAKNPGLRILKPYKVSDYGGIVKEIGMIDVSEMKWIENALRSPRSKVIKHPHRRSGRVRLTRKVKRLRKPKAEHQDGFEYQES